MKNRKLLAIIVGALVVASAAIAVYADSNPVSADAKPKAEARVKKDPLTMLQQLRDRIQQRLDDGKISKDKADKETARIDKKVKELQDFNALTLDQKKDKLIKDFTAAANKKVEAGKLTQQKADESIAKYTDKINKWDGNGYPFFTNRGARQFEKNARNFINPNMKNRLGKALDNAVKDGKITADQKQNILDYFAGKKPTAQAQQ